LDGISKEELQAVFRSWIECIQNVIDANGDYISSSTFWLTLFHFRPAPLWVVYWLTGPPTGCPTGWWVSGYPEVISKNFWHQIVLYSTYSPLVLIHHSSLSIQARKTQSKITFSKPSRTCLIASRSASRSGKFVPCQELLDLAEEIRDRSQRMSDRVSTVSEVLFSSCSASEIPRPVSPYASVRYRHGRSFFDRFHRPDCCAILATEQGCQ
jgi:hypothetical protein